MTRIIDSPIHYWDLNKLSYPWLDSRDWKHVRTDFGPHNIAPESSRVDARVHVQAEMDHSLDPVRETAWLNSLRLTGIDREAAPTVSIGYADLTADDLPDVLDRHAEYPFSRGIRREAWYLPDASGTGPDHTDLLGDPRWEQGLRDPAVSAAIKAGLEIFGPGRSMIASNFPVDSTCGSYSDLWDCIDRATEDLADDDRADLYGRTAANFHLIPERAV